MIRATSQKGMQHHLVYLGQSYCQYISCLKSCIVWLAIGSVYSLLWTRLCLTWVVVKRKLRRKRGYSWMFHWTTTPIGEICGSIPSWSFRDLNLNFVSMASEDFLDQPIYDLKLQVGCQSLSTHLPSLFLPLLSGLKKREGTRLHSYSFLN